MTLIYVLAYMTSLIGLLLWFLYKNDRPRSLMLSKLFLGGFLIYLVALSFASGDLAHKLIILFRDFAILAVVAFLFDRIQENKIALLGFAIVLGILFKVFYINVLFSSFPNPLSLFDTPVSNDYEFLIRTNNGEIPATLADLSETYSLTIRKAFQPASPDNTNLDDYLAVDVSETIKQSDEAIYKILRDALPADIYIELNDEVAFKIPEISASVDRKARAFTNDPKLGSQWWMHHLQVDKLHKLLRSHPQVNKKARIAIIDTGVDAKHEDINSYVSINKEYDEDLHGHGTICTGIISATTNNSIGIASMGVDVLMPEVSGITVMNRFGFGNQIAIIEGMIEAADAGFDVISMSLGGKTNESAQEAYSEAVRYCLDKDCIVVVSAGNSSTDARGFAPAGIKGVIAVGATDANDKIASFSNYVDALDMAVFAPGVSIYSTKPNNKYGAHSGTSFSGPMVAALAGIMRGYKEDITSAEVYKIMHDTGIPVKNSSKRRIQPAKAIETLLHQSK